jgi:hypothetical protein
MKHGLRLWKVRGGGGGNREILEEELGKVWKDQIKIETPKNIFFIIYLISIMKYLHIQYFLLANVLVFLRYLGVQRPHPSWGHQGGKYSGDKWPWEELLYRITRLYGRGEDQGEGWGHVEGGRRVPLVKYTWNERQDRKFPTSRTQIFRT